MRPRLATLKLRQRFGGPAAARIARPRVIDGFPANLLLEPYLLRRRESVGIVERRGRHVGNLGAISVCVGQGRAAIGAEPTLDAGRGCECGGFAASEREIRCSKYCPRQRGRAGCPAAAAAVTHHERRWRRGDPIANRAAEATTFFDSSCHGALDLFIALRDSSLLSVRPERSAAGAKSKGPTGRDGASTSPAALATLSANGLGAILDCYRMRFVSRCLGGSLFSILAVAICRFYRFSTKQCTGVIRTLPGMTARVLEHTHEPGGSVREWKFSES
jgi:hypothetical protein